MESRYRYVEFGHYRVGSRIITRQTGPNSLHLEATKALACLLYPRGLNSMYRGAMEPS
jgi:hypothetical protein